jgi:hypothetical protein
MRLTGVWTTNIIRAKLGTDNQASGERVNVFLNQKGGRIILADIVFFALDGGFHLLT